MERITSKNNSIIKDTRKLITSSKARDEKGLFVLEGARLCFDVLNSVYKPETVLITEAAYGKYKDKAEELAECSKNAYLISGEAAEKLGDTKTTQGVFAVCKMENEAKKIEGNKLLALDKLQDPANLGAIIRTAEALGIDGIITFGCCDVYNPKTLRASMGSVLRVKLVNTDNLEKMLTDLKKTHGVYSTVPSSEAVKITDVDFSQPCVCVIGNEANGVEDNIKAVCDGLVTIPMLGNAESLNAGVAAAITMWEMLR